MTSVVEILRAEGRVEVARKVLEAIQEQVSSGTLNKEQAATQILALVKKGVLDEQAGQKSIGDL